MIPNAASPGPMAESPFTTNTKGQNHYFGMIYKFKYRDDFKKNKTVKLVTWSKKGGGVWKMVKYGMQGKNDIFLGGRGPKQKSFFYTLISFC